MEIERDEHGNVPRKENFSQVCLWEGTSIGELSSEDFEKFIQDQLETRAQFLEVVTTKPDSDENGNPVPDTGGRSDIIFAIHSDDIGLFAGPRFKFGIRWIEDVLDNMKRRNDDLYDSRINEYRTW